MAAKEIPMQQSILQQSVGQQLPMQQQAELNQAVQQPLVQHQIMQSLMQQPVLQSQFLNMLQSNLVPTGQKQRPEVQQPAQQSYQIPQNTIQQELPPQLVSEHENILRQLLNLQKVQQNGPHHQEMQQRVAQQPAELQLSMWQQNIQQQADQQRAVQQQLQQQALRQQEINDLEMLQQAMQRKTISANQPMMQREALKQLLTLQARDEQAARMQMNNTQTDDAQRWNSHPGPRIPLEFRSMNRILESPATASSNSYPLSNAYGRDTRLIPTQQLLAPATYVPQHQQRVPQFQTDQPFQLNQAQQSFIRPNTVQLSNSSFQPDPQLLVSSQYGAWPNEFNISPPEKFQTQQVGPTSQYREQERTDHLQKLKRWLQQVKQPVNQGNDFRQINDGPFVIDPPPTSYSNRSNVNTTRRPGVLTHNSAIDMARIQQMARDIVNDPFNIADQQRVTVDDTMSLIRTSAGNEPQAPSRNLVERQILDVRPSMQNQNMTDGVRYDRPMRVSRKEDIELQALLSEAFPLADNC